MRLRQRFNLNEGIVVGKAGDAALNRAARIEKKAKLIREKNALGNSTAVKLPITKSQSSF